MGIKALGTLVALLLVLQIDGHPTSWTSKYAATAATCLDHPTATYMGHMAPAGTSNSIVFTLKDYTGAVATSICATGPSQDYSLQVDVGAIAAEMLLTTTAGSLTSPTYGLSSCNTGSRIASNTRGGAMNTYNLKLAASCAQLAGKVYVTLQATCSNGQFSQHYTNSLTIPVAAACSNLNTSCTGTPVTPSPAPPTTSPVPPPTTSPVPPPTTSPVPPPTTSPVPPPPGSSPAPVVRPVYPDCIGAALLPNPCPLGRRCFYDTQCKPQTQATVAPLCDNAAPLPNPWPTGKCCFYDSECKPQCEDKGDKRCPKLPPCGVLGCAACSATNSSQCERCWAGYILNVDTKRCECAPGYYGTTSCGKCAAGTVSYGGKLPTAKCTTCPAGRVANKEQSECVVAGAWDHWGMDLTNRRWGYSETTLTVSNIGRVQPKWTFTAGSDVTATPVVVGGRLYVPDWDGNVWCLDATTGATIWRQSIAALVYSVDANPYPPAPANSLISRASPAISGSVMVVPVMKKGGGYPYLFALNTADGSKIWGKRVDDHPAAMLTMSPTIHAGYIYQGVSSLEELLATNFTYPCCTFRGNMLKVDLATGSIIWRTYMVPDNGGKIGGFSGNSLWGSSPAVDVKRNQVYIATGNNYEIPEDLTKCLAAVGPLTTQNFAAALECERKYGQENYHNSILALDMTNGTIKWIKQLGGPDAWNGACGYKGVNPNCAKPGLLDLNSPDYDFGQAPMLVTACKAGSCKQLVVAGQKSGWLWALSPDTGDVHWSLPVGPGGTVGGLQWGSAADNSRIYVSNNNYLSVTTDLTGMNSVVNWNATTNQRPPTSTDGGIAAAVDAYDGTLLWTFANPTVHWGDVGAQVQRRARSQAPMTVVNDVVFYPSMDIDGTLFFLDARTGKLLGSFQTGMTTGCGPSVVNGKVYVGSGYKNFGLGLQGNKLHMLSL